MRCPDYMAHPLGRTDNVKKNRFSPNGNDNEFLRRTDGIFQRLKVQSMFSYTRTKERKMGESRELGTRQCGQRLFPFLVSFQNNGAVSRATAPTPDEARLVLFSRYWKYLLFSVCSPLLCYLSKFLISPFCL